MPVMPQAMPQPMPRPPAAPPAPRQAPPPRTQPAPVIRGQKPDEPKAKPAPKPIAMPSPEQLGIPMPARPAPLNWTDLRVRLDRVGATGFSLDRVGDGYRFACKLPNGQTLQADGATEDEAVSRVLTKIEGR